MQIHQVVVGLAPYMNDSSICLEVTLDMYYRMLPASSQTNAYAHMGYCWTLTYLQTHAASAVRGHT